MKCIKFFTPFIAAVAILTSVLMLYPQASSFAYFPAGKNSIRYKMTVTVKTPEGIKTGSVVREVYYSKGLHLTPEMNANIGLRGEAVIVDLGKHGVLFALMRGTCNSVDYGSDIIFCAYGRKEMTGKVILDPNQYPYFVRSKDLKNSSAIEGVTKMTQNRPYTQDYSLNEEMSSEGISLQEVSIEITDEAVTSQIYDWLPWLDYSSPYHKPGSIGQDPNLPFDSSKPNLHTDDFVRKMR